MRAKFVNENLGIFNIKEILSTLINYGFEIKDLDTYEKEWETKKHMYFNQEMDLNTSISFMLDLYKQDDGTIKIVWSADDDGNERDHRPSFASGIETINSDLNLFKKTIAKIIGSIVPAYHKYIEELGEYPDEDYDEDYDEDEDYND